MRAGIVLLVVGGTIGLVGCPALLSDDFRIASDLAKDGSVSEGGDTGSGSASDGSGSGSSGSSGSASSGSGSGTGSGSSSGASSGGSGSGSSSGTSSGSSSSSSGSGSGSGSGTGSGSGGDSGVADASVCCSWSGGLSQCTGYGPGNGASFFCTIPSRIFWCNDPNTPTCAAGDGCQITLDSGTVDGSVVACSCSPFPPNATAPFNCPTLGHQLYIPSQYPITDPMGCTNGVTPPPCRTCSTFSCACFRAYYAGQGVDPNMSVCGGTWNWNCQDSSEGVPEVTCQ